MNWRRIVKNIKKNTIKVLVIPWINEKTAKITAKVITGNQVHEVNFQKWKIDGANYFHRLQQGHERTASFHPRDTQK